MNENKWNKIINKKKEYNENIIKFKDKIIKLKGINDYITNKNINDSYDLFNKWCKNEGIIMNKL